MPLGDGIPVIDTRTAQRICSDTHSSRADRVEIEHVRQVVHIGAEEVVARDAPRERLCEGHPLDARNTIAQKLVRARSNDRCGVAVGRTAVRRVVFESAVPRRIVRRSHHDAVGLRRRAGLVVPKNCVTDRWGGRVPIARVDQYVDTVGRQHFQRRRPGGFGQCVSVPTDEQRPGDALCGPVLHDRLRRRHDVRLVERRVQTGPSMS